MTTTEDVGVLLAEAQKSICVAYCDHHSEECGHCDLCLDLTKAIQERPILIADAVEAERERCALIADPPLMHRKGNIGLWRRRRAEIAAAIRAGEVR